MKRINVLVTARAKNPRIIELAEPDSFKVYVASPAVDGKANKELTVLLADRFGVKARDIHLVQGAKSRRKVIGIVSK